MAGNGATVYTVAAYNRAANPPSMRRALPGWRSLPSSPPPARSTFTIDGRDFVARDGLSQFTSATPWRGVRWSVLYAGFLLYIAVATTYWLPAGDVAIAMSLVSLLIEPGRIRVPPFLVWLAAFLAWCSLGFLTSEHQSIVGESLYDLGKLWLILLVAVNALSSPARIRLFMVVFAGCFALFPLRGAFFNYIGGYTTFGRALWNYIYANPNDLAALALLQLGIVSALLVSSKRDWIRPVCSIGIVLLTLLIVMTQSRAGLLGLAVFGVAFIVENRRRLRSSLVVKVGVLVTVIAYLAPQAAWDRFSGLQHATSFEQLEYVDREGSARQRAEIWKVAARIISEHPVTGVGLGAYREQHAYYAESADFAPTARGRRDTHSTFLNIAADTGLVGLALFIGAVASVTRAARRARRLWTDRETAVRRQLMYLELGLAAFLVAGIWGSFGHLAFTHVHLALIWAFANALLASRARAGTEIRPI